MLEKNGFVCCLAIDFLRRLTQLIMSHYIVIPVYSNRSMYHIFNKNLHIAYFPAYIGIFKAASNI